MTARVEMLLYHGLDTTSLMEFSDTSIGGPWTEVRLPSTLPVLDALAAWVSTANVNLATRVWSVSLSGAAEVTLSATGGAAWVKVSATLAQLLGLSSTAVALPAVSSEPLALIDALGVGSTFPVSVEESELDEYTHGRGSSYHWARVTEVEIELGIRSTEDYLLDSPIVSGHAAYRVEWGEPLPFDEDHLDGALTVYPYDPGQPEHEAGDPIIIVHKCTMDDPT